MMTFGQQCFDQNMNECDEDGQPLKEYEDERESKNTSKQSPQNNTMIAPQIEFNQVRRGQPLVPRQVPPTMQLVANSSPNILIPPYSPPGTHSKEDIKLNRKPKHIPVPEAYRKYQVFEHVSKANKIISTPSPSFGSILSPTQSPPVLTPGGVKIPYPHLQQTPPQHALPHQAFSQPVFPQEAFPQQVFSQQALSRQPVFQQPLHQQSLPPQPLPQTSFPPQPFPHPLHAHPQSQPQHSNGSCSLPPVVMDDSIQRVPLTEAEFQAVVEEINNSYPYVG